jgi:hypothetical protein
MRFGSNSATSCPRDRNACATAAPECNETSRSAPVPPNITVIFNLAAIALIFSVPQASGFAALNG